MNLPIFMQVRPFGKFTDSFIDLLLVILEVAFDTTIIKMFLLLKYVGDFFKFTDFFHLQLNSFLFFSQLKQVPLNLSPLLMKSYRRSDMVRGQLCLRLSFSKGAVIIVIEVSIFLFEFVFDSPAHHFGIPCKPVCSIFLPFPILLHDSRNSFKLSTCVRLRGSRVCTVKQPGQSFDTSMLAFTSRLPRFHVLSIVYSMQDS